MKNYPHRAALSFVVLGRMMTDCEVSGKNSPLDTDWNERVSHLKVKNLGVNYGTNWNEQHLERTEKNYPLFVDGYLIRK